MPGFATVFVLPSAIEGELKSKKRMMASSSSSALAVGKRPLPPLVGLEIERLVCPDLDRSRIVSQNSLPSGNDSSVPRTSPDGPPWKIRHGSTGWRSGDRAACRDHDARHRHHQVGETGYVQFEQKRIVGLAGGHAADGCKRTSESTNAPTDHDSKAHSRRQPATASLRSRVRGPAGHP